MNQLYIIEKAEHKKAIQTVFEKADKNLLLSLINASPNWSINYY